VNREWRRHSHLGAIPALTGGWIAAGCVGIGGAAAVGGTVGASGAIAAHQLADITPGAGDLGWIAADLVRRHTVVPFDLHHQYNPTTKHFERLP
jgi:hypothetical protein